MLIADDIGFGKILFFCSFIAPLSPSTHVISLLLNPQEFSWVEASHFSAEFSIARSPSTHDFILARSSTLASRIEAFRIYFVFNEPTT